MIDPFIKKLSNNEMLKQKALSYVNSLKENWEKARRPKEKIWLRAIKNYKCQLSEDRAYRGRAHVFVPETAKATESIVPLITNTITLADPMFILRPVADADENHALLIQKFLHYQLDNKIAFKTKYPNFCRLLALLGWAAAKTKWLYEEKVVRTKTKNRIPEFDPLTGQQIGEREEIEIIEKPYIFKDQPDFIPLNPANFLINPRARDVQDKEGIIEIIDDVPISRLRKMDVSKNEDGIYFDTERINGSDNMKTQSDQLREEIEKTAGINSSILDTADSKKDKCRLLEFWGMFDFEDGNGEREAVITIANGNNVIRLQPNPYFDQERPYIFSNFIPMVDDVYGIGIGELTEKLQYELNDKRNQALDLVTFSLLNIWAIPDDWDNIEYQLRNLQPRDVIRVPDPTLLTPVRPPSELYQAIQVDVGLKNDFREVSGATNPVQGFQARSDTTATEIQTLMSQATNRFKLIIQSQEETVIKPFIRRCYRYNMQFKETSDFIEVLKEDGAEIVEVTPDQIIGDYEFIVRGSSGMLEQQTKLNYLTQFLNIAMNFELKAPGSINWRELLRRIWTQGLGFTNPEKIIIPEPNTLEQARMQGMLPGVAGQGGNAPSEGGVIPPGAIGGGMTGGLA